MRYKIRAGCMQTKAEAVKIANANLERPAVAAVDRTVLRASHPIILKGPRQVQRVEPMAAGNPSGVSILQRTKERALKDVTNKLDSGPINLKPAWNGLQVGAAQVRRNHR